MDEGHHRICLHEEASYDHRIYNAEQRNFCTVPEKGFDAVLFAAIGITFTCLAPRKHYAIVMLLMGAALQILNIEFNIRELSNALNIWIGITPAKLFFYIFLPPLLLDSAVRIDFFVFKKVMVQVFVFAFFVVSCNTVLLAVFMLYVLNLRDEGWEWTDAFLFACMIASTDALAVTAIMKDGSGPESLIVLAEGESLFNDATSIVFFDLFWPRFKDSIKGTLKHEPLFKIIGKMALDVAWLAFGGALIGLVSGYITRILFKHLQKRSTHTPVGEVGITVGVAYLCYYVAESVVKVSGVIAVVVYGLYGAATTQWDISARARSSQTFAGFWDVTQLLTNGIVFFYAGASATNFFYRCEEDLFDDSDESGLKTILAWLPGVYIGIFLLRFLEIAAVTPIVRLFGSSLSLREIVFISLAGLRGALALILAQELLQYEFPAGDFEKERIVRAQSALWVCGFVLLTLLINAPGIPFLLKICGLQDLTQSQIKYQKKARQALKEHTKYTLQEMQSGSYGIIRGVNWSEVEAYFLGETTSLTQSSQSHSHGNVNKDAEEESIRHLEDITAEAPVIPSSNPEERMENLDTALKESQQEEAPFEGTHEQRASIMEPDQKSRSVLMTLPSQEGSASGGVTGQMAENMRMNEVVLVVDYEGKIVLMEQGRRLPKQMEQYMERQKHPILKKNYKFFASTSSYFNLMHKDDQVLRPEKIRDDLTSAKEKLLSHKISFFSEGYSHHNTLMKSMTTTSPLLGTVDTDNEEEMGDPSIKLLTEARFRLLLGLKKHFQARRTEGYLSPQGLRLLEWACDMSMEEKSSTLKIWQFTSEDIESRIVVNVASKIRYFLRKATLALEGMPSGLGNVLIPIFSSVSSGLSKLLVADLSIAIEAAVECWIGLNAYKTHSSWLVDKDENAIMNEEVSQQLDVVWHYIIRREVEAPERFQAIQTHRAKSVLLESQISYVDGLFDCGLIEEGEHEYLKKELEYNRAEFDRKGLSVKHFEVFEFLRKSSFLANVSNEVFRQMIHSCRFTMFKKDEEITFGATSQQRNVSGFHIVVNGILKSSFLSKNGKEVECYLGRGATYGLLGALTGESPFWTGQASAELNAMGQGPSILTVPKTTLDMIKNKAQEGDSQYQQARLDLHRVAALYVIQYLCKDLLYLFNSLHLARQCQKRDGSFVQLVGKRDGLEEIEGEEELDQGAMKETYETSLHLFNELKAEILTSDLVVIPPESRFVLNTTVVMLNGTLAPVEDQNIAFSGPMILFWTQPTVPGVKIFTSGKEGATLISCPASASHQSASASSPLEAGGDQVERIEGSRMAALPHSAAFMMNESMK